MAAQEPGVTFAGPTDIVGATTSADRDYLPRCSLHELAKISRCHFIAAHDAPARAHGISHVDQALRAAFTPSCLGRRSKAPLRAPASPSLESTRFSFGLRPCIGDIGLGDVARVISFSCLALSPFARLYFSHLIRDDARRRRRAMASRSPLLPHDWAIATLLDSPAVTFDALISKASYFRLDAEILLSPLQCAAASSSTTKEHCKSASLPKYATHTPFLAPL